MKLNIGSVERIIRVIVGVVLMGLAYTGTLGVWAYSGVILLVTGLVSWCPLWFLFKVNTRKDASPSQES